MAIKINLLKVYGRPSIGMWFIYHIPIFLLVALQKTPSLLGAECQGVGTTPLHANERGQTVRFVAVIEPPVYWGISIS